MMAVLTGRLGDGATVRVTYLGWRRIRTHL
jgi:hypothetical protein